MLHGPCRRQSCREYRSTVLGPCRRSGGADRRAGACAFGTVVLACLLSACWPQHELRAATSFALSAEQVSLRRWTLHDARAELRLAEDGRMTAALDVAAAREPRGEAVLGPLRLECLAGRLGPEGVECAQGRASLGGEPREAGRWSGSLGTEMLRLSVQDLRLAGGALSLDVQRSAAEGAGRLRLEHASLAQVQAVAAGVADLLGEALPLPVVVSDGALSLGCRSRRAAGAEEGFCELELAGVSFSDAAGLRAGEDLGGRATLHAQRPPGAAVVFDVDARLDEGAVFLDPLYLEPAAAPLHASLRGRAEGERVAVQEARVGLGDRLAARAAFEVDLASGTVAGEASMPRTPLAPLFEQLVSPFLLPLLPEPPALAGEVEASLRWAGRNLAGVDLSLFGAQVEDGAARFGAYGIDATAHWDRDAGVGRVRVEWDGGAMGRLDFGAATLALDLAGREFVLREPLRVPVAGGALEVQGLEGELGEDEKLRWRLDAELTPISLETLSSTLAWPPLEGQAAARLEGAEYHDGILAVDGTLRIEVFDGTVSVSDITLRDLLGAVPELGADVRIDRISLAELTRTLSFGSIEGRLSGRVDDLLLQGWRPVEFDAYVATPPDAPGRRRISQRAVDNLSRLGGAGAVLSSTFLRFFQEFSYDRLGLSCRLRRGVCAMGGVEDAEQGYYIVKGGGLPPRVNVFGFNRQVDWELLLERLRAITVSGAAPVVR